MAATRRPALDSAARCPLDAMASGNCPRLSEASSLVGDYGGVSSCME